MIMLLFPPPLEIGDDEGFTPEKDIFGRASLGKGLTNLVTSTSAPLVIAVDGQWGSGKSTFLKMWAGELRKQNLPVILFDAFEHDYVEDAFGAVAGEIIALVKERKKLKTSKGKKFAENTVKVAKVIARAGVKIGAKAATLGIFDGSEFDEFADDVGDAAKDFTDSYLMERQEERDTIKAFKDALSDLPELLAGKSSEEQAEKPLIFIIDELDRCRPSFALAVLERMKHFFSVANVHFVLGLNAEQLHTSIRLTYGDGIDANQYLQKFIQIYFFLYDKADHRRQHTAAKFIHYLFDIMKFDKSDEDANTVADLLIDLAILRDLDLRSIEKIMTTFAIAFRFTPKHHLRLSPILAGLAVLKVIAPAIYKKAKQGLLEMKDLDEIFGIDQSFLQKDRKQAWLYKWWNYVLTGKDDDGKLRGTLLDYDFESSDIVPYLANDVIDRFLPQ